MYFSRRWSRWLKNEQRLSPLELSDHAWLTLSGLLGLPVDLASMPSLMLRNKCLARFKTASIRFKPGNGQIPFGRQTKFPTRTWPRYAFFLVDSTPFTTAAAVARLTQSARRIGREGNHNVVLNSASVSNSCPTVSSS